MSRLFLGLGSNLGDREANILRAIDLIGERVGKVVRTSSFLETEPCGFKSEHRFINAVCLVETELQPMECLYETQRIERQLGRKRKSRKGIYHDRPIDIDLLLYDDVHMESEELTLPHPHIEERDFVRIPLEEVMSAL